MISHRFLINLITVCNLNISFSPPQDQHLHNFFHHFQSMQSGATRPTEGELVKYLKVSIDNLEKKDSSAFIMVG